MVDPSIPADANRWAATAATSSRRWAWSTIFGTSTLCNIYCTTVIAQQWLQNLRCSTNGQPRPPNEGCPTWSRQSPEPIGPQARPIRSTWMPTLTRYATSSASTRPWNPAPRSCLPSSTFRKNSTTLKWKRSGRGSGRWPATKTTFPKSATTRFYDIAHLSFLVVRTGEEEFKAFHNACLHRGTPAERTRRQAGAGIPLRVPRLGLEHRRLAERSALPLGLSHGDGSRVQPARGQSRALGRIRLHQSGRECGRPGRFSRQSE